MGKQIQAQVWFTSNIDAYTLNTLYIPAVYWQASKMFMADGNFRFPKIICDITTIRRFFGAPFVQRKIFFLRSVFQTLKIIWDTLCTREVAQSVLQTFTGTQGYHRLVFFYVFLFTTNLLKESCDLLSDKIDFFKYSGLCHVYARNTSF